MSGPAYDVAVVGLGPTGAVLATALGRAGVRTVVFERDDTPYSQPRACHLDAETARILARHGFEHALAPLLTVSAGMEYVDAPRGQRLPVDFLFRSLAQDQHERAIGIVLSGTASDGTAGVRAIKGAAGMVMARADEAMYQAKQARRNMVVRI